MVPSRLLLIFSSIFLTTSANSQTEVSDTLQITPDQFTQMILGNLDTPENSRLYRPESNEYVSDPDRLLQDGFPVNFENLEEVSISTEDAHAIGTLMLIKRLVADINRFGIPNSVKLYSHGYGISEDESNSVVVSVLEINDQHQSLLNEIKVSNCLSYEDAIKRGENAAAVEKFAESEKKLNTVTRDYFRYVNETLAEVFPSVVYENFQDTITQTIKGMSSASIDLAKLLGESGKSPEDYFSASCQRRLHTQN